MVQLARERMHDSAVVYTHAPCQRPFAGSGPGINNCSQFHYLHVVKRASESMTLIVLLLQCPA